MSLLITVGRGLRNLICRKVRSLFSFNRDQHLGQKCSVIIVQASSFLETVSLLLFTTELIYSIYIMRPQSKQQLWVQKRVDIGQINTIRRLRA